MNAEDSHVAYRKILDGFLKSDLWHQQSDVSLPYIPYELLSPLCEEAIILFRSEPTVLSVKPPVIVVGDIHGHLPDLIRILEKHGLPDNRQFLFLGDLVDRGEFSIEAVVIIFILKVIWPSNVFIIRGNHEFQFLCDQCGFSKQLMDVYGDDRPILEFLDVFSYIPLAAIIGNAYVCVHGGIGPSFTSISQISSFQRPILDFGDEILDSLLWSDPSTNTDFFMPSNRGTGYIFGQAALETFLAANHFKMLIRGHECVTDGCESCFGNKLLTVFSASNYCGLINNSAAVVLVRSESDYDIMRYPPLEYLRRSSVFFIPMHMDTSRAERKIARKKNISPSVSSAVLPRLTALASPSPIAPMKRASLGQRGSPKKLFASQSFVSPSKLSLAK